MPALAAGLLWAALVAWVLARVVRQGRAHRALSLAGTIAAAPPIPISTIIPVRNERDNIEPCLRSLTAQEGLAEGCEFIVVDDDSSDGTADRVRSLAGCDPRIKLIRLGPLPAGWMGKPHACWRGADAATAEWLCFVDADVRAAPQLLATAAAAAQQQGIDMLSLSPFQELGSFWERLIVPAGLLLIAGTMDLRRIDDPSASQAAANGQFLLFRRAVYFDVGGHRAVREQICEDKALAVLVKRRGGRYRFLAAEHLARTRMYTDFRSLWSGLAKNAVEMLGTSLAAVSAASAAMVFGWTALALPAWSGWLLFGEPTALRGVDFALCLFGSLAVAATHVATARHCRVPLAFGLLFALSYTAAAVLTWHSLALRRSGQVRWKGRVCAGTGGTAPEPP